MQDVKCEDYLAIGDVQQRHVLTFLNGPLTSTITWRAKYGLLRHFFLYWVARGEVPAPPLPVARAPVIQTHVPYIYSRAELHLLFAATRISQKAEIFKIDAKTLRTFLLFLYATGALVGEGRRLQLKDVDFKRKRIAIRNDHANRSRDIPISADLNRILKSYQDARPGEEPDKNAPFFVTTDGATLNETTVAKSFQRARTISGITPSDGAQYGKIPEDDSGTLQDPTQHT